MRNNDPPSARHLRGPRNVGALRGFQHSPELAERFAEIQAENEHLEEETFAARRRFALLDSAPIRYHVTLVALALAVTAFGNRLASSPFYLASFKITVLLTACLILVMLRKYRGAQTASWYLCLVCTVLTFRWLTYNSMFLT